MIRLTLALLAVIFLTFSIAGTDRGQVRYGLMTTGADPIAAQTASPETLLGANPEPEVLTAALQSPEPAEAVIESVYVPVETLIPPTAISPTAISPPPISPTPFSPPEPEILIAQTPEPEPAQQPNLRYIAVASANVREGPSKDFAVLERLPRGEAVSVVATSDAASGWTLIRIEGDGIEGYISTSLLADQP